MDAASQFLKYLGKDGNKVESSNITAARLGALKAVLLVATYTCPGSTQRYTTASMVAISPDKGNLYEVTLYARSDRFERDRVALDTLAKSWKYVPDRCALPSGLDEEISHKYPGTSVVSLADLDDYDRKLFQKDHGSRCPGLVKVDFYGDGKPTWALVLVGSGQPSQRKAELVVARQAREGWKLRLVDTADASSPVVWRQGPGKY